MCAEPPGYSARRIGFLDQSIIGENVPDLLFDLAARAAKTGESLDDLFRRYRPDLFRQIKRQLRPIPKNEPIKRHAISDAQKRGD